MRQQFEDYLKAKGLAENTIRSRISNCKRVEEYEGNLDRLFDDDELRDLERRLSYTRDDQGAGRPLNHKIPIDGDEYTGSASLKASVRLYRAFRNYQNEGSPPVTPIGATHQTSKKLLHSKSLQWPVWPQPQPDEELALARIVARYARFLRPEIVQAIVEDNEKHRAIWSEALAQRKIDPNAYLWPRSACAFPGVRRYAGSTEIAIFRKRTEGIITNALALDDNDYPKQIWAHTLIGKKFPKHGPHGYALAHLADHKTHKNKAESDFHAVDGANKTELHGLYTSAANAAFVPVATIKPTDHSIRLRNLLKRRAADLYGAFCEPLPAWLSIPQVEDGDWSLECFDWAETVGDPALIPAFLNFRAGRMQALIAAPPPDVEAQTP
ncbi:hypothetical protein [Ottowia sp.]|jgi:hypothetical protein|uniref:hypothetical protein n=1 Tax=Ottowia sp. TaxID=1898956 RepID=UPI0025F3CC96|nr:hypothetical protein [Ottowia sp.]MBK6614944.1 hypothetical protein [Ottowia sp.]MBK6746025.1 hypothetical protein [Ottowia sp.]